METNTIITGKAEDVLPTFEDNIIDMIITSPPYNFGRSYDEYGDNINHDEYFHTLNEIWEECYRILKPDGRIAINIMPIFTENIPTHHIISQQLRDIGFGWKSEILWEKNNYSCPYTCWGSWCSPSAPYLKYSWEFIEVFVKSEYRKSGKKEDITITPNEFKEFVYAKWSVSPEHMMKKFNHPAMFPEAIPQRLIRLFTYKNDIILDPFNGVGTTTKMAHHESRRYIGIDVSKRYCDVAKMRIRDDIYRQNKLSDIIGDYNDIHSNRRRLECLQD